VEPAVTADEFDRAAAWATVCEFTASETLRRHMLAVEAAMRAYAEHLGEDVELWGVTGLLHDFDYERHPKAPDHPVLGEQILAERGWPANVRRAILTHASYTGLPRESPMELALHACDEVTGFLTAVALVRPDRDLRSVAMPSVRKKWKSPAFAAGVDRAEVESAARAFGVELDAHLAFVLSAMQSSAESLGLAGS
jgi:putative nucleotidyltransferase with HDIG domain